MVPTVQFIGGKHIIEQAMVQPYVGMLKEPAIPNTTECMIRASDWLQDQRRQVRHQIGADVIHRVQSEPVNEVHAVDGMVARPKAPEKSVLMAGTMKPVFTEINQQNDQQDFQPERQPLKQAECGETD